MKTVDWGLTLSLRQFSSVAGTCGEFPHRKAMLTLLAATKDIGISEAAVPAELVLS